MAEENNSTVDRAEFKKRVWLATGIIALVVVLLWIFKAAFNVLLLILAGILIAIYFRGLSGLIQRKLHVPEKWSLPISIVGSILLLLGFLWFAGARIQQQAAQLSETLPSTIEKVKGQINKSPIGQKIMQQVSGGGGGGGGAKGASPAISKFFRSTFGVLGDIYVILFLGIFFTASPKVYENGFMKLIPAGAKGKSREVVREVGDTLRKWLKGQLFAMLVVAVLTLIGLVILGVPMAFVLALIAGLLNFIPNFGPLIAMVPAVLVGFMQGPTTALLVAGLYIVVQVLESNLITPQIQKRLIEIPPALIIISQMMMGALTGGWGLVLSVPIIAIVIVVVGELYVKNNESSTKVI